MRDLVLGLLAGAALGVAAASLYEACRALRPVAFDFEWSERPAPLAPNADAAAGDAVIVTYGAWGDA